MDLTHQDLIYFSPTHTTQKILSAISEGTTIGRTKQIDLTLQRDTPHRIGAAGNELVIIGAPVYSGRIPPVAAERLRLLKGNGTPAVIVVVYGNRESEDALLELVDIAKEAECIPIGAAAFIGEHSFASEARPIALGRPDAADLKIAGDFGSALGKKLKKAPDPFAQTPLQIPGNTPYKELREGRFVSPDTDSEECTLCEACAGVCPVSAIRVSSHVATDKNACIICCACVKECPSSARRINDPGIEKATNWLYENCSARKEPETFI
jgi:ferredoxin